MSTLSVVRPLNQLCLKRGRFVELSHEFMVEVERVFAAAKKLPLLDAPFIIGLYHCATKATPQTEEAIINEIDNELRRTPYSLVDTGEVGYRFDKIRIFLDYIWEQARFGYIRYLFEFMATRLVDYDGYKQANVLRELGREESSQTVTPYRLVRFDDPTNYGRSVVYIDPTKSFTSQYPLARPIQYDSFKGYWICAAKYIKERIYAEADAPDPAVANGDFKNLNWGNIDLKLDLHSSHFASVCCLFDTLCHYVDHAEPVDQLHARQIMRKTMERVYNRHMDLSYERMFWNFLDGVQRGIQPLGMFDIETDYKSALIQLRAIGVNVGSMDF